MKLNKKTYFILSALVLILLAIWIFTPAKSDGTIYLTTTVQKGNFISEVYSTGQLQTENSELIVLPNEINSRNIDIYEIKVTEIVEEGTVVDSGEYVATLDHAAVEEIRAQAEEEYETAFNAYEDAKIDTNLNLSTLRDELLNARVDLEEKKIILDQSIYESPAVKRQAQLDVERANRDLEQKQTNYTLKKKQDEYKVFREAERVRKQQKRLDDIDKLFNALDVTAPKPGLVIYSFDRNGKKIKPGSTISRWRPQIAELPDLTSMISKTFINEIDISKIKVGQKVKVGIDAFPEKSFNGEVIAVANIGQVIPKGDAKVFEVTIKVEGTDNDLRPAMTTSNVINTANLQDVMYAPMEAVFSNDSVNYVFIEDRNIKKQIVSIGATNENFVVLKEGVEEGDVLLMNQPEESDDMTYEGIEIYNELKLNQKDSVSVN